MRTLAIIFVLTLAAPLAALAADCSSCPPSSTMLQVQPYDQDGTAKAGALVTLQFGCSYCPTMACSLTTDTTGRVVWCEACLSFKFEVDVYAPETSTPFPGRDLWSSFQTTRFSGPACWDYPTPRQWPYAKRLDFDGIYHGDCAHGDAELTARVLVRSPYYYPQTIRLTLLLDRDGAEPFDLTLTAETSFAGGEERVVPLGPFTLPTAAAHSAALLVETFDPDNHGRGWVRTDAWNWSPCGPTETKRTTWGRLKVLYR